MAPVSDEWLCSQEKNTVIPEAPRRENYYFLAKWFRLEINLNLLLRSQILKYRSYTVTELN